MTNSDSVAKKINTLFLQSGLDLSDQELILFTKFYGLLTRYNKELDLSRLHKFEDIIVKHFIDSVYFTKFVRLPSPLVDIGTGAGFPGIPLKIMNPHLSIILAEPRHKRVSFMEMTIKELGLTGIEVYPHLVTDKSFFEVRGVITRALESADDTLSRVSHFLPRDGMVLLMKGPEADKDLDGLSEKNTGRYSLEENRPYTLPGTNYKRRIVVLRHNKSALSKTYCIMKDHEETIGHAIMSADNKKFKELKKISAVDGIKKLGRVIVPGKKIIQDLIKNEDISKDQLIIHDGYIEKDEYINNAITEYAGRGQLLILKKGLFNELDRYGTGGPLLSIETPALENWDYSTQRGCTVILPFQDPINTGSAIRTAAGFNAEKIVVLRESAHPYHPRAIRASAGAVFTASISRGPSINDLPGLIEKLQVPVISLDLAGESLDSFSFPESFILIPGIEGPGLPELLKINTIKIPISQSVESLNAAVALSIALYEWKRQKK